MGLAGIFYSRVKLSEVFNRFRFNLISKPVGFHVSFPPLELSFRVDGAYILIGIVLIGFLVKDAPGGKAIAQIRIFIRITQ